VKTSAYTTTTLVIGQLSVQLRFEVLDESISTILGMPFLETTNP
jgi:hypothetical protein